MEIKYLKENMTLTGLTKYLNGAYKKQTGKQFTTNDVWQYIRLGHIPEYIGGNKIEMSKIKSDVKLYNLLENG